MKETSVQTKKTLRVAIATLAATLVTPMALAQGEIKIGYNSDMSATGSADFGVSALAGARYAANEINAAGGVLGKKLVIVPRDDTGSPPKSIQNTNELVNNEGVAAMLGGVNSGNMLAWMHISQQKKIPTISPSATASEITNRYAVSLVMLASIHRLPVFSPRKLLSRRVRRLLALTAQCRLARCVRWARSP